ncbi:uncharacterized protein E0L32_006668, partial [Thyridium curvatum]
PWPVRTREEAQTISSPLIGFPQRQSRAQQLATRLYDAVGQLQGGQNAARFETGAEADPVTLVCISDTHNTTPRDLPPGDILLHAGDLSQFGTFDEIQAQLTWLAAQPHQHKVVIAGNHDLLLDSAFVITHPDRELDRHDGKRRPNLEWGDVRYLEDDSLDLEVEAKGRSIRVYGSPRTPRCGMFAFQYETDQSPQGARQRQHGSSSPWYGTVPERTDVLLVHGPPLGHRDDGGKGCWQLLAEIWRTRPKVVVCGHIHVGRGMEWLLFDRAQKWYEDTMSGRAAWVSVAALGIWVVWSLVARVLGLANTRVDARKTLLINAAVVGDRKNGEVRNAIVVEV